MEIFPTPKSWFTNLMEELYSIIKSIILYQFNLLPFIKYSKLLLESTVAIQKCSAVSELASVKVCWSKHIKDLAMDSKRRLQVFPTNHNVFVLPHHPWKGPAYLHSLLIRSRWIPDSNYPEIKFPVWQTGLHLELYLFLKWNSGIQALMKQRPCPIISHLHLFYPVWVEELLLNCVIFHYYQLVTGVFH